LLDAHNRITAIEMIICFEGFDIRRSNIQSIECSNFQSFELSKLRYFEETLNQNYANH